MAESLLREVNEISGRPRIPNKLCHVNFGASGKLGLVVLHVNGNMTAVSSMGAAGLRGKAPPTTQAPLFWWELSPRGAAPFRINLLLGQRVWCWGGGGVILWKQNFILALWEGCKIGRPWGLCVFFRCWWWLQGNLGDRDDTGPEGGVVEGGRVGSLHWMREHSAVSEDVPQMPPFTFLQEEQAGD